MKLALADSSLFVWWQRNFIHWPSLCPLALDALCLVIVVELFLLDSFRSLIRIEQQVSWPADSQPKQAAAGAATSQLITKAATVGPHSGLVDQLNLTQMFCN